MKKFIKMQLLMVFLIISFIPVISQAQLGVNNASNNAPSMPGELLVQLKAGITGEQKGKALERVSAELLDKVVSEGWREDQLGDLPELGHD